MASRRRINSLKVELVAKSRDAALTAIKTFNDPLIRFKSETYVVLMIIAWTYLLHAYYRQVRVDYRYYKQGTIRKRYDRTKSGSYKCWELERCLNDTNSPIDKDTANNLRFLIGLRHEVEHQMTLALDSYLGARYQACALNYNRYLKRLFGNTNGLESHLSYSLQFLELTDEQIGGPKPEGDIPANIRAYIAEFDGRLTDDEFNNQHYAYRLLFVPKLVNRRGQADKVIEFIPKDSPLAEEINKEYWVRKDVERAKYRASDVATKVRDAGFGKFRVQPEHLRMWKAEDAKNPGKGYGVDVQGTWYWYGNWITRCIELCTSEGDKYK